MSTAHSAKELDGWLTVFAAKGPEGSRGQIRISGEREDRKAESPRVETSFELASVASFRPRKRSLEA